VLGTLDQSAQLNEQLSQSVVSAKAYRTIRRITNYQLIERESTFTKPSFYNIYKIL